MPVLVFLFNCLFATSGVQVPRYPEVKDT